MNKIIIVLLALIASTSARADVGLLGGLSFYNYSSSPSVDSSSSAGLLLGLSYTSSLAAGPGLEIDALYDQRKYSSSNVTVTLPAIQIPVLVRMNLIPEVFDYGIGAYYAFGVGDVSTSAGTSSSYSAAGVSSSDFGLIGSLQVTIPIPGITKLIADGRYLFGLSNSSSTAGVTAHTREMELFLGFLLSM